MRDGLDKRAMLYFDRASPKYGMQVELRAEQADLQYIKCLPVHLFIDQERLMESTSQGNVVVLGLSVSPISLPISVIASTHSKDMSTGQLL